MQTEDWPLVVLTYKDKYRMSESTEIILLKMEQLVIQLVKNAEDLKLQSKGSMDPASLDGLQEFQEKLVAEIMACDHELTTSSNGNKKSFENKKEWKNIESLLNQFQGLNTDFINNVKVRQGLIQFEVKELRKAKQLLMDMKNSYTTPRTSGNQSTPGSRINTTS
jgi:hypothetical protein